jgi:hypothetical protein
MARFVGLHTVPGFSKEMLSQATPALERLDGARFVKAYSSFSEGKIVCEFEAPSKAKVAEVIAALGFPYDDIVEVQAICDGGDSGVVTSMV